MPPAAVEFLRLHIRCDFEGHSHARFLRKLSSFDVACRACKTPRRGSGGLLRVILRKVKGVVIVLYGLPARTLVPKQKTQIAPPPLPSPALVFFNVLSLFDTPPFSCCSSAFGTSSTHINKNKDVYQVMFYCAYHKWAFDGFAAYVL